MKIQTKITDITQDDLVNLLSTAGYGSCWLGLNYDMQDLWSVPNFEKYECVEDKMAAILLNGRVVILYDMYAEDSSDFYGKLPHSWDDVGGTMDYEVTLKDIVEGIEKALNNGGWDAECAMNLMNADEGQFDQPQAENLIQWVIFGESVYG